MLIHYGKKSLYLINMSKIDQIYIQSKTPSEYGFVEDCHLIINHKLAHWYQCKFKKK